MPFEWDPRNGPLILDIAYAGGSPALLQWDGIGSPHAAAGIVANSANATVASFTATAPVIRLCETAFVLPTQYAAAEAPNAHPWPWSNSPAGTRTLDLYDPSALPFSSRVWIDRLAWRTNAGSAFPGDSYQLRIVMSTSPNSSSTIVAGFEPNHGADRTVVFEGTWNAPASPSSSDPTAFDLFVDLQRPFEYDPSLGSIVVDVTVMNLPVVGTQFDNAPSTSSLPIARVVQVPPGAPAVTGRAAAVIGFHTRAIPPTAPSILAIAVNPHAVATSTQPFSSSQGRVQSMVAAAEMGITEPTFVRHLRFRPKTLTGGPFTFTGTIDLSNPTNNPGLMSNVFDANHGLNRLRVFDGQFSVPWFTRTATDLDFLVEVKLQRPFLWTPATNPYLTVDIRTTAVQGSGCSIETTRNMSPDPVDASITALSANATSVLSINGFALAMQLSGEGQNGLAINYGSGCNGTNGVPQCTTRGTAELPNVDFGIRIRNARPGTPAFLLIGLSPANSPLVNAPGCNILTTLDIGTWGFVITNAAGEGLMPFPVYADPAYHNFGFRTQWIVYDPGANALGFVTSDAQQQVMVFF
jgi:hypothetical protein